MYVNPFWLGVGVTLLVILALLVGLALIFGGKKK